MRQIAILASLSIFWAIVLASLSGGGPQQADPQAGLKEVADGLRKNGEALQLLAAKMEAVKIVSGSSVSSHALLKPVTVLHGNTGAFPVKPGDPQQKMIQLKAPFDGWLLGWQPWLGFDRGAVVEAGFGVWHDDKELLVMSPHKEAEFTVYDSATMPQYFAPGYARAVKKDDIVTLVCFVANTGKVPTNAHGMARVYFGQ